MVVYSFGKNTIWWYIHLVRTQYGGIFIWEEHNMGYIHLGRTQYGYIHLGRTRYGYIHLVRAQYGAIWWYIHLVRTQYGVY